MLLHPVHSFPQSQEPDRGGSDGNHGGQANTEDGGLGTQRIFMYQMLMRMPLKRRRMGAAPKIQ